MEKIIRKFILILVAGAAFFLMTGCSSDSFSGGDDIISSVNTSDLTQGYLVTYSNSFTISYCEGRVEKLDLVPSVPVVGKWGSFETYGDLINLDLYYQMPGYDEFIHEEWNMQIEGNSLTVGSNVELTSTLVGDGYGPSTTQISVTKIEKIICGEEHHHDEDHSH